MSKYIDKIMRDITSYNHILIGEKFSPVFVGFLLDESIKWKTGRFTNIHLPPGVWFPDVEFICGLKIIRDSYDILLSYYTQYGGEVGGDMLILVANCKCGILGKVPHV